MPTLLDHGLVLLLAVGVPLLAAWMTRPHVKAALCEGPPETRIRTYWLNVGLQWALTGVALGAWAHAGRRADELGFTWPAGWQAPVGLGIAMLLAATLTAQYVVLMRTGRGRRQLLDELRRQAPFAPQTRRELGHFMALAVTAGVCEEILYRGFLIWYVSRYTGTTLPGLAAAVILATAVFGLGHAYQGAKGVVQVSALALLAGVLYVWTGSLLVVIPLHVAVDVIGGIVCRKVYAEAP